MVEDRTPKFCSVCGTHLVSADQTKGYDPYTGEPEKIQNLSCPNPTIKTGGVLGGKSYTYHPSWTNSAGNWDQY